MAELLYITRCIELPETLVPNTVYCVRRDDGLFDVHFTDETASNTYRIITREDIIDLIANTVVSSSGYSGLWDASTNTPNLQSGVGNKGDMYKVSVPGTTVLDSIGAWEINDLAVFDGTIWDKIPAGGIDPPVTSVAGKVGDVSLTSSDVGLGSVDNLKQLPHTQTLQVLGDVTCEPTALNGGTLTLTLKPGVIPTIPVTSVAGKTGNVSLSKSDVGLGSVDNLKQLPHTQTLQVLGDVTCEPTALNGGTLTLTLNPDIIPSLQDPTGALQGVLLTTAEW